MTRRWVGAVLVLALPGVAVADDDYRHGRIRYVEDGVSIQRAAEPGAEEAEPNIPFLPGDRIWTDERGRVEFQFDSGAFLRLDNGTKLDYLDNPGDRVVLRLWSGGLYVHEVGGGDLDFEIETPGGVVNTRGRGVYRIDAHSGETRISVYEGEATLQGGRGVRIREGERVYARDGEVVRGPMAFDRPGRGRLRDVGRRPPGGRAVRAAAAGGPSRGRGAVLRRAVRPRLLGPRAVDRLRVAPAGRGRLAAVLVRPVDVDGVRMDVAPQRALGLGAVPLRALGILAGRLVLDPAARRGARPG